MNQGVKRGKRREGKGSPQSYFWPRLEPMIYSIFLILLCYIWGGDINSPDDSWLVLSTLRIMDCSSLSDGLKPCFLNTWTINTVTVGRRIFHTNCTFPSSSVVISSVRSTSNNAKASLRQSRSWVVIWRSRLRQGSQDCLDLALDLLLILANKYVWASEQFWK